MTKNGSIFLNNILSKKYQISLFDVSLIFETLYFLKLHPIFVNLILLIKVTLIFFMKSD
jgi:hypothetical protein